MVDEITMEELSSGIIPLYIYPENFILIIRDFEIDYYKMIYDINQSEFFFYDI